MREGVCFGGRKRRDEALRARKLDRVLDRSWCKRERVFESFREVVCAGGSCPLAGATVRRLGRVDEAIIGVLGRRLGPGIIKGGLVLARLEKVGHEACHCGGR